MGHYLPFSRQRGGKEGNSTNLKNKIFHSVNSGLYFGTEDTGIFLDGLHGHGPYQCFSPMPELLRKQMVRGEGFFAHLSGALFSHGHGDHCDPDKLYFIKNETTPTPCFLIGDPCNTLPTTQINAGIWKLEAGPFTIFAIETGHNGIDHKRQALFDLPTCVFLIQHEGERFLAAGDGQLTSAIERIAPFGPIDLAFCNSYHLATPENLAFFQLAQPKRIALYHLPFPEDDVYLAHGLAAGLLRNPPVGVETPFLLPHMSWYGEDRPKWALDYERTHREEP